jgi:hypothetical protein
LTRAAGGDWVESEVDSTYIKGSFGAASTAGNMSGHISLALTPTGIPVIVGSSTQGHDHSLVIYAQEGAAFKQYEIDLLPVAAAFGLSGVSAAGTKQLLIDEAGVAHVALIMDASDSRDILYLALDQQWRVIDQRDFPASEFFGMGLDGSGTIHIAMR